MQATMAEGPGSSRPYTIATARRHNERDYRSATSSLPFTPRFVTLVNFLSVVILFWTTRFLRQVGLNGLDYHPIISCRTKRCCGSGASSKRWSTHQSWGRRRWTAQRARFGRIISHQARSPPEPRPLRRMCGSENARCSSFSRTAPSRRRRNVRTTAA